MANSIRQLVWVLLSLVAGLSTSQAQDTTRFRLRGAEMVNAETVFSGKSRAIVVGIADYHDPEIPDLQFADRDAQAFYEYLRSPAGGGLMDGDIRFMLNEKATLAAIDDALNWISASSKKGDRFIFYFAGHGDVEKQTLWQLGYLLAHDTPSRNYRNNAVRLEDINDLVTTLSVGTESKVIVIMDACRSGKLAGSDSRGPSLTAEQLAKRTANEVRILSCKPDQLSMEGIQWGDGRGMFSFYLVNGLKGLADDENDGIVTLEELQAFLKSSMKKSINTLGITRRQDPVIEGSESFRLGEVTAASLAEARSVQETGGGPALALRSTEKSEEAIAPALPEKGEAVSTVFNLVENTIASGNWQADLVASGQPNAAKQYLLSLLQSILRENKINQTDSAQLAYFMREAGQSPDPLVRQDWWNRLAVLIHDSGQKTLNDYLNTDAGEIRKRSYVNKKERTFENLGILFDFAARILETRHPLFQKISIKSLYFKGVSLRIDAMFDTNPAPRIQAAAHLQLQAFNIDEHAPFILNELGILSFYIKDYSKALHYFQLATDLAPRWALPYSNLSLLYYETGDTEKAKTMAEKAIAMQPDYYGAYTSLALCCMKQQDLLCASDNLHKSILLNPDHYLPYQQLGILHLRIGEFHVAENFFVESSYRLQGLQLVGTPQVLAMMMADNDFEAVPKISRIHTSEEEKIILTLLATDPNNPTYLFDLGQIREANGMLAEAESLYRKAILIKPNLPGLSEQYGDLAANRNDFGLAEQLYKNAIDVRPEKLRACIALARLYERSKLVEEAANNYRKAIENHPDHNLAYYELIQLFEKSKRYEEAEQVVNLLASRLPREGADKKVAFYNSRIREYPAEPIWYYKKALALLQDGSLHRRNEKPHASNTELDDPGPVKYQPDDYPNMYKRKFKECVKLLSYVVSNHPAWMSTGDLYFKMGLASIRMDSMQSAATYLSKALESDTGSNSVRLALASFLPDENRLSATLDILLQLHRNNALSMDKQLQLGRYLIYQGNYQVGEAMLDSVLKKSISDQPEARTLTAVSCLLKGNYTQALKVLNDNLKRYGKDPDLYYNLAKTYAGMDKKEMALRQLEKAFQEGWKYRNVLEQDPAWNNLRREKAWQQMMERHTME